MSDQEFSEFSKLPLSELEKLDTGKLSMVLERVREEETKARIHYQSTVQSRMVHMLLEDGQKVLSYRTMADNVTKILDARKKT